MKYRCGHCKAEFQVRDSAGHHSKFDHGSEWIEGERPDGIWHTVEGGPPASSTATEGRKDDSAKIRMELIAPELLFAIGDISTFGALKYGDRNWELGMNWSRVFGALMRHMWAWWGGGLPTRENFLLGKLGHTDDETGKSHLWHAGCCLMYLIAYEARGTGTDDRPK